MVFVIPTSAGCDVRQTPKLQTVAVILRDGGVESEFRIVVVNSLLVPLLFAGEPPGADHEMLVKSPEKLAWQLNCATWPSGVIGNSVPQTTAMNRGGAGGWVLQRPSLRLRGPVRVGGKWIV